MGISNHLSPTRRPDRVSENEESHLLVSDPKKYIYSSLFNEVYLLSQFPLDHRRQWSGEEGQFNSFFESFLSFSQGISKKEMALWDHNQTIENWIIPLLTILGWTKSPGSNGGNDNILLNTSVEVVDELGKKSKLSPSILVAESTKGRDIIEGSKGAETVTNIRNHSLITVTTDYFNAWSDVRSGNYDHARNATFVSTDQNRLLGINDQSTSYLGFFEHPWAISTDGYTWRLYSQDSSILNSDVYFEFKVGRIFDDLRTGFIEDGDESAITSLKLFYWLFSKEGLAQGALSIGTKALAKSNLYFKDLEDDLKGRFIHAITILSNDILTRAKVKNVKDEVLYKLVRNTSESLIFTLLFLRSCESRRVIPLNQKFLPYSVSNLIRKIRYYDPTEDIHLNFERLNFNLTHLFGTAISPDGFEIFEYFLRLKDIIQKGTENKYDFGFKIEGFKESIFEREETQILNDNKVTNGAFVDLLFTLFY
ncbi:MAG: hypothetical protein KDD35_03585, partial [Bdellovibrionales bacterium]|nr:hypothetical protein [Bdellovibrionales bacterium]